MQAIKQLKVSDITEIWSWFDLYGPDVVTKTAIFAAVLGPYYLQLIF